MGIDLRLLPCEHWHEQQDGTLWGNSHTILDLGSVSQEMHLAFEALVKPHLVTMPEGHHITSYVGARVPEGFYKGESIYGTIRDKDAYGSPYEVVTAEHLLPWLAEHFQYDGHLGHGPYQASIVAYVRALPSGTKIIFDWH